jgi:hypothetical protein
MSNREEDLDSKIRSWKAPAQARRETNKKLARIDPDSPEPLGGHSMRTGSKPRRTEHTKGRLERSGRGRPKVWKARFWKRRKNRRQERARYENLVARQGTADHSEI